MYFHPARPPRTDKHRISTTRWQNYHPTSPNPGQIDFKMAKTQRPQRLLLLRPGEDRPWGATDMSLVRLFGSDGCILQHKHSDKPLGTREASDASSTLGGEVGCPPKSAPYAAAAKTHTFWCHESSEPQVMPILSARSAPRPPYNYAFSTTIYFTLYFMPHLATKLIKL